MKIIRKDCLQNWRESTDGLCAVAALDRTSVALVGGSIAVGAGNGSSNGKDGESKNSDGGGTVEHGDIGLIENLVEVLW